MKKVSLIGKKVMAVGLAASLLLPSGKVNECSAYFPSITNIFHFNRGTNQNVRRTVNVEAQTSLIPEDANSHGNSKNEQSDYQGLLAKIEKTAKMGAKVTTGVLVAALIVYLGITNTEGIKNFFTTLSNFYVKNEETISSIGNGGKAILEGIYGIMKSGFSVGGGFLKVLYNIVKANGLWNTVVDVSAIYGAGSFVNKVKNWTKGNQKNNKVKNFDVTLKIKD